MPLRFSHIFVVTYGRSGSTLLGGILNSVPGICVRGENDNALFHLFCAINAARHASSGRTDVAQPSDAWYGGSLIDADNFHRTLLGGFIEHVLVPPTNTAAIGFKEIRYDADYMSDEQFDAYMDFLLQAFERACIIFNIRSWQDVARSEWWIERPFARRYVTNCDARFERAARRHSGVTFKVKYDDYVRDPDNLRPLFEFLGATFDRGIVADVLARPHSFRSSPEQLAKYRHSRSWLIASLGEVQQWLRRHRT